MASQGLFLPPIQRPRHIRYMYMYSCTISKAADRRSDYSCTVLHVPVVYYRYQLVQYRGGRVIQLHSIFLFEFFIQNQVRACMDSIQKILHVPGMLDFSVLQSEKTVHICCTGTRYGLKSASVVACGALSAFQQGSTSLLHLWPV